jgi:glycosyltransferase involved in cell wall biosynthesis
MKKILYLSTLCSEKKYAQILKNHELGMQVNKFDKLLAKGFGYHAKSTVFSVLTYIDHMRGGNDYINESESNIDYVYPNLKNSGIRKYIELYKKTYAYIKDFTRDENSFVVLNLMCMTGSFAAIRACKKNKRACVGVLTDLPAHLMTDQSLKSKIKQKIHSYIINKCDSYVFLTESMKDKVAVNGKKYIVVEGSVDCDMQRTENKLSDKYEKKVCHYAGMLFEKYGVSMMVEAFIKASVKNAELHIYGSGDYANKLKTICEKHKNIIYHGIKLNDVVVAEQIKSTILINPRTSEGAFTKYSFPSKNLEYMASGTPTLLCNLPGMPDEYTDYVFVLKDETVDGMSKMLKQILSMDLKQLHGFGDKAKQFVLINKSNIAQTQKILDFIDTL